MASTVADSVRAVFVRVGDSLPVLVGAVIILVAGWVIAGIAQKGVVKVLKTLRVDDLSEKIRISEFLNKGDIKLSLSELVGVFLYWLLVLAFGLAALNALGLTVAAGLLDRVLGYVPDVLAGIIVLVLGFFFAAVVSGLVQTATANMGVTQARGLAQISRVRVSPSGSVHTTVSPGRRSDMRCGSSVASAQRSARFSRSCAQALGSNFSSGSASP